MNVYNSTESSTWRYCLKRVMHLEFFTEYLQNTESYIFETWNSFCSVVRCFAFPALAARCQLSLSEKVPKNRVHVSYFRLNWECVCGGNILPTVCVSGSFSFRSEIILHVTGLDWSCSIVKSWLSTPSYCLFSRTKSWVSNNQLSRWQQR